MYSNCPSCFGAKETRQLGNILGKCLTCKGQGFIDQEAKPETEDSTAAPTYIAPPEHPHTVEYYAAKEAAERKAYLKNANVAHLNAPVVVDIKPTETAPIAEKPPVVLNPNVKQAPSIKDPKAPKPLDDNDPKVNKLRKDVKPRSDEMMASQSSVIPAEEDVSTDAEKVAETSTPAKGKSNAKKEAKSAAN